MQKIEFKSGGERLEGTLCMPNIGEPPYPGVIFFHGLTSSQDKYIPMAEALAQVGIAGMTVNIRAHGQSGGTLETLTARDGISDCIIAYNFLSQLPNVDPSRLGLCGGSFGGLLAASVSQLRDVKSIVQRAPATYSDEMMQMKYTEIMADQGQIFFKIANAHATPGIRAMEKFKGSLLVVACELDAIIPRTIPQAYYDAASAAQRREFIVLKGAEHSLQTDEIRKQFTDQLVKWFLETL